MARTRTYPYTTTKTRTEAVVDQFDIFLQYAGIGEPARVKLLDGVQERWLEVVAVYLCNEGRKRILEARVEIAWTMHSDYASISPTVNTDLPGWESGAAPEIRVIGHRFGQKARELNIVPNSWVLFTPSIRNNSTRHAELCAKVGVSMGHPVPEWQSKPTDRSMKIIDLDEVSVSIEEAGE